MPNAPDIAVDEACDWDDEACDHAIDQAHAIMPFDPDGAAQLLAQAQAAQRKRGGPVQAIGKEPYDPMKLYARMKKYYGMSHAEMDNMHFPTFFGYVREAQIISEEEKAEYDKAKHNSQGAQGQGLDDFPHAKPYEGETVPI